MIFYLSYYKSFIRAKLSLFRGRVRIFFNACPLCNSDAPALDQCPLCNGYHSAKGDSYPPESEVLARWRLEYAGVIRMKIMTLRAVLHSRLRRTKSQ